MRAYDDNGLNDIRLLGNVRHFRHALALFEDRCFFKVKHASLSTLSDYDGVNRSFQTAWFIGLHGDLGGANKDDGLALWPLQWILSEAQKQGLLLEFSSTANPRVEDPSGLIFPDNGGRKKVLRCANGISIDFHDMSDVFSRVGYGLSLSPSKSTLPILEKRVIFKNGALRGWKEKGNMVPHFIV